MAPEHDQTEQAEVVEVQTIEGDKVQVEVPSRDAANWAKTVSTLNLSSEPPPEAINLNVTGRRLVGPMQGFGKMWQKTYKVPLEGANVTPQEVIKTWKANFPKFWPERNWFYGSLTGIAPGDVALLNLSLPGRIKLSTGVLVMYADDESFSLMCPQGHQFAGWNTFSSHAEEGATIAQIQVLIRGSDPIYEIGLALGGHRMENKFWQHTLKSLAAHFGVEGAEPSTELVCVDKKRQWANASNVRYNAAIRSGIYAMGTPFRSISKAMGKRKNGASGPTNGA